MGLPSGFHPLSAGCLPRSRRLFGRLEASLLKGGAVIQLARATALQGSIASSAHVEPSASAGDLLTGGQYQRERRPPWPIGTIPWSIDRNRMVRPMSRAGPSAE